MGKLISMTDFVLQDWSKNKGYDSEDYRVFAYYKVVVFENYANFLKQSLTLGMFVPCDENGNILEAGGTCKKDCSCGEEDVQDCRDSRWEKYQKAKEKVLFEDAVTIDNSNYSSTKRILIDLKKEPTFRIYTELQFQDGKVQKTFLPNLKKLTIEDLIKFDLQLSESAIKQIYGNG